MHYKGAVVAILNGMDQAEEVFADVGHLQCLGFFVDSPLKCSIPYKLCDNVELVFIRIVYDLVELKYVLMVL
jgi:hypothetical protein